jgi:Trk K+ transport system NAD-binding subunit
MEATVAAVQSGGRVETLARDRTLGPGDTVYVIGRPETYRRLDGRNRPGETGDTEAQSS